MTLNDLAALPGRASEALLREEVEESGLAPETILNKLRERLGIMRDSIRRVSPRMLPAWREWWGRMPRPCGKPRIPCGIRF